MQKKDGKTKGINGEVQMQETNDTDIYTQKILSIYIYTAFLKRSTRVG